MKTKYTIVIIFNILLVTGVWFVMQGNPKGIHFSGLMDSKDEPLLSKDAILKQNETMQDKNQPSIADLPTKPSDERQITTPSLVERDVDSVVPIKQERPLIVSNEKYVVQNVPFLVQAPFGEWSKAVFQHACEETSIIMAMSWVKGESLSPQQGKTAIESITKFETKKFGKFVFDTSLSDTADVMKEYFQYDNVEIKRDIQVEDIRNALLEGAIVIVPANGQLLRNPNFTAPGPLEHMLVIIGYDPKTKEFITNDPGTRNGAGYRYNEDVLYGAIRDYATGNHIIVKDVKKAMLVIRK